MSAPGSPAAPACPVCGWPVPRPGPAPCGNCGLPAVAQAAAVVGRMNATVQGVLADRDALLATLRATATAVPPPPPTPAPVPAPAPIWAAPSPPPPAPSRWLPQESPARPVRAPRRRLSPQQVLVGLGALLMVAAAVAFVAVAWTRLGVAFQAAVMSAVTALVCWASAGTARRGLRATEEALAATGVALLAVDLAAARALGLFRLEEVPVRLWTAVSCALVLASALALGRLTRTTATWPLAALLAAQPLPFLLLPADVVAGPAGVAVALTLAGVDLLVARRLRPGLRRVALALAAAQAVAGTVGGLVVADRPDAVESWSATALLAIAGAAAALLAAQAPFPRPVEATAGASVVVGLALTLSLRTLGEPGPVVAAGLGLALLTGAVLLAGRRTAEAAAWAGGGTLTAAGCLFLLDAERWTALSALALAALVPSVLAAVRRPALRYPATGIAVLAAAASAVLAHAGGLLSAVTAGLLLALVAALAFGVATLRSGRPEERVAAVTAGVAGLTAAAVSSTVGAWGQVGLQLAVAGAAAAGYAVTSGRRTVGVVAVADLVVASWIALAGAQVTTPEAYTLPAAAGLLLVALPRFRAGERSWTVEGPGLLVALAPSAMVVVAEPSAFRLVLVVVCAAAVTVAGTLTHRQAPFAVGTVVLIFVTIGLLGPDVLLLPRWLTLGAAGLLLFAVGATYERRRQQAREAVAWVAQMR